MEGNEIGSYVQVRGIRCNVNEEFWPVETAFEEVPLDWKRWVAGSCCQKFAGESQTAKM